MAYVNLIESANISSFVPLLPVFVIAGKRLCASYRLRDWRAALGIVYLKRTWSAATFVGISIVGLYKSPTLQC